MVRKIIILIFAILQVTLSGLIAEDKDKDNGIISGLVIDKETRAPVFGALIKIVGTDFKSESNENGKFIFEKLKYDTYALEVSSIGYVSFRQGDIVVASSKPVDLVLEAVPASYTTGTIEVEANYYQKPTDVNISMMNLDYEEVRRAPGAAEDISRMLQTAPGVSIVNDSRNDLVVRGGSPAENLIMIDGIEIPNINHYGSQGTSGGPIGYINLKFIREADIFTGGFTSKYGDKMSSVVDIKFRDGSSSNYINNIDMSMAGFGGVFEGPFSRNFTYLFSVRRSYLDLLKNSIRLAAVPNYWDFNLKLNYKLNENNSISLIGFAALDKIKFEYDPNGNNADWPYDSEDNVNSYTAGINYTNLFKNGYMQFIASNSYSKYFDNGVYAPTGVREYYNDSYENEFNLKYDLYYKLSSMFIFNFNAGWKKSYFNGEMFTAADTTPEGYFILERNFNTVLSTNKYYSSINLTSKLFKDKLIINSGLRLDYFDYINNKTTIAPRIGLSYSIFNNTNINASYGIYYQTPVYTWLISDPNNSSLNSIRCDHYIAGIEHYFSPEVKATLELYRKNYDGYAVSNSDPRYILIDGGANYGPNIVGSASSSGHGFVSGVDFMLQKKLSGNGIYGMVNYSYSKSGFFALEGGEKPGAFDPTHQFTIIAGYQIADDWLIGLKFKYAGGRPYTPFDVAASKTAGRGVYDMSKFNSERYPDYSRLDLRVDKKFIYKKITITAYLEFQNLYNRENIFSYFWNKDKNEQIKIYQWAFMPVGGFNLEF